MGYLWFLFLTWIFGNFKINDEQLELLDRAIALLRHIRAATGLLTPAHPRRDWSTPPAAKAETERAAAAAAAALARSLGSAWRR